ncbi:MAG: hypothetical protein FWD50_07310 [Betaproteobacteria bacterium]|nr:hypothetical protein [Betaproteobacteria bacterium]
MSNRVWLAFKFVLSVLLVAAPLALFVVAPRAINEPMFLGLSAALLYFAALPWVNFTTPNRGLALAGIVFSSAPVFVAAQTVTGNLSFPRQCLWPGAMLCDIDNLLFAVGGEYLAAAPFAILAVFIFVGSISMLSCTYRITAR